MRKNSNRPAPKLAQQRLRRESRPDGADGFSIVELVIAMGIVLVMMAGASSLLMNSLGARTRESQKSDALADAQRALNIMSREIGNSGFGLDYNGLVAGDCHPSNIGDPNVAQIRLRANVDNKNDQIADADEDVTFVYQDTNRAIVRYDAVKQTSTVLAGEIDAMQITYIDSAGGTSNLATTSAVENAVRVRITIRVDLQQTVGQPASQVLLTSEIALRNAPAVISHY
jgi:type II secretory pathway pseudopilin PulG